MGELADKAGRGLGPCGARGSGARRDARGGGARGGCARGGGASGLSGMVSAV